jgi:hypothetical protein
MAGKTFPLQHQQFEEVFRVADERCVEEALWSARDDMSNRELFETDSWIGKKMRARFGALAVHFAQGTTTTGTNVRTLPGSVPCLAETHESVDEPICITPAEKDK